MTSLVTARVTTRVTALVTPQVVIMLTMHVREYDVNNFEYITVSEKVFAEPPYNLTPEP